MDLKRFSDERLAEHLSAVLNEQERRSRLSRVPVDVAKMTAQYIADGGDKEDILNALKDKEPETPDETDEQVSPTPTVD